MQLLSRGPGTRLSELLAAALAARWPGPVHRLWSFARGRLVRDSTGKEPAVARSRGSSDALDSERCAPKGTWHPWLHSKQDRSARLSQQLLLSEASDFVQAGDKAVSCPTTVDLNGRQSTTRNLLEPPSRSFQQMLLLLPFDAFGRRTFL